MPVNFPDSPALNQVYAYESRSWKWNGKAWVAISAAYGPTGPAGVVAATSPITYNSGTATVGFDQTAQNTTNDARYAQLGSANAFTVGGHTITNTSDVIALNLKGNTTQTNPVLRIIDSSNVVRFSVTNGGGVLISEALYSTSSGRAYIQPNFDVNAMGVVTGAAANKGLVVRGAASQTANLQEWQDSAGTVQTAVNSSGLATVGGSAFTERLTITGAAGSNVDSAAGVRAGISLNNVGGGDTRILAGIPGVSNSGFSVFSGSTLLFGITGNREFLINGTTNVAQFVVFGRSASTPVSVLRGVANQTADLVQHQASSSTVLGGANALAQSFTGSTAPITVATGGAVSGTSSGTTATLTTASAHGLAVGDLVTIAGMTPSGYNGTYLVGTVPTTTSFTVTTSGSNLGNSTVSGTVSASAQASVTARSAGTVALAVRPAASAVVNLQEWQNSSGTAVAYVSTIGSIRGVNFANTSSGNNSTITPASTGTSITTAVATNVALTVQNTATTPTGNLTEWRDSTTPTSNIIARMSPSGQLAVGGSTVSEVLTVSGGDIGGGAGTRSGLALFNSARGQVRFVMGRTGISNVGLSIILDNTAGTSPVTALVIDNNTQTSINSTSTTLGNNGSGANSTASQFGVVSSAAGTVGAVVRGATTQTANLMEWQDSAGAILAQVRSSGAVFAPSFNGSFFANSSDSTVSRVTTASTGTQVTTATAANVVLTVQNTNATPTGNLTEWRGTGTPGTLLARVDNGGWIYSPVVGTTNLYATLSEANSGGQIRMTKQTAAASNPGTDLARLYFRDGTNAGTLKLVVRAGSGGGESTIVDNIQQTSGSTVTIDGGSA